MRWVVVLSSLIAVLVIVSAASADVDIQYVLSTGNVESVRDTPPSIESVEGYGIVTLTGVSMSAIAWPVPSGCTVGQSNWTTITDPGTAAADGTGMVLRSGLLVFHTTSSLLPGCFEIQSEAALWALVNRTLELALATGNPLTTISGKLNVAALGICPPADVSADCTTLRADLVTWNAVPGGAAVAMHFLMVEAQLLKDDATTFIAANF